MFDKIWGSWACFPINKVLEMGLSLDFVEQKKIIGGSHEKLRFQFFLISTTPPHILLQFSVPNFIPHNINNKKINTYIFLLNHREMMLVYSTPLKKRNCINK